MFLAWFDADKKKPATKKIEEARARYVEKFGEEPIVCLVNDADTCESALVEVRADRHIGRGCFWIGKDDTGAVA